MYALSYEIRGKLKQGSPKELALVSPVFSGIYSLGRYAVDEEIRQYRADRNPKSLKKLAKLFIAAESLSKNNKGWLWKAFFYSLLSDSLKDVDKEITQAEVNIVIGEAAGKIKEIKGEVSSALVGALIQTMASSVETRDTSSSGICVLPLPVERLLVGLEEKNYELKGFAKNMFPSRAIAVSPVIVRDAHTVLKLPAFRHIPYFYSLFDMYEYDSVVLPEVSSAIQDSALAREDIEENSLCLISSGM